MGLAVLASPMAPWKGAPLRVVVTTETALEGELSLIAPNGKVAATSRDRHGGPPYSWFAEVPAPEAGNWHAKLTRQGATGGCAEVTREIAVRRTASPASGQSRSSVWPLRGTWNRASENLYSAWIEKLFDAPIEEQLSWPALHEVLRDPARNFLFNHLSLREDQQKLVIRPDCADLPYFLRAYFAFKMGLPFGYAKCSRGGGGKAPQCPAWWNIQKEEPPPPPPPDQTSALPGGGGGLFGMFEPPAAARARERASSGAAAAGRPGAGIRILFAPDRRQRRALGLRTHGRRRRRHRLLPRVADPADAAPRHHLRRSIRAHPGGDQARRPDGRRGGRVPRRRRAAGRHGGAQALLARQLPVRPGSRARRSRLQALPAHRRREGRHATAEQRRDHQGSAVRRLLARAVAAFARGLLRSHGRGDVAGAARSDARHAGGDHGARGAGEGARERGRERPEIPGGRRRRGGDAGRRLDLRDDRARGKTSRHPRATCGC